MSEEQTTNETTCPCCVDGKCQCPPCQDGKCTCPCCANGNCPCPENCPNCDCC